MRKTKVLQFSTTNAGITHYDLGNWKWMNKDNDFATVSKILSFEGVLGDGIFAERVKEQVSVLGIEDKVLFK